LFDGDLSANCPAKSYYPVINDAVKNLYPIAPLGNDAILVQRIEVLRHIRLGRDNLGK